jgi:putative heme-binding domain-containing protein
MNRLCPRIAFCLLFGLLTSTVDAQKKPFIPRRQDKPPGPPLSPAAAMKRMQLPPGFTVELVASEPQLVNPVAMCFDEKGRIWVTESLEYPRRRPGKGRDRVKVLEDTDGDGKVDKTTVVIEGLNIPSGVNVGFGGVWVANSPDILFYPFKDRDNLKLGKPQVVVTGFGRSDTHELPNSLVWGPDGWLYGLNGVFNYSRVHYGKSNPNYDPKHPGWKFTCAMWRIHPRTRKFELFAEGTSNPWGIAFNEDGEAFVSACVIDHLWHITETGYYHRQGGPYPPHTWKIGSIVKHHHQKAAYCGIHYYDSDAYPKEYRGHLYMGNIHGGCINVDTLQRDGSTYFAKPRPDFLTANDVWFMPVVQKTGPDGCLYILDWYDRYHCYQDANADPRGVDRLHGRLYRIRYKNTPRAKPFDLAKETDDQLIQRLQGGNGLLRRLARRVLTERNNAATKPKLRKLVLNDSAPRRTRLEALWALLGTGPLDRKFNRSLLKNDDAIVRAWGVRALRMPLKSPADANVNKYLSAAMELTRLIHKDPSPIVKLQIAIATRDLRSDPALSLLPDILTHSGNDRLIPHIVWNNLKPRLSSGERVEQFFKSVHLQNAPGMTRMLPHVVDFVLDQNGKTDAASLVGLAFVLNQSKSLSGRKAATDILGAVMKRFQSGELKDTDAAVIIVSLRPISSWIEEMGKVDPNAKKSFTFQYHLMMVSMKHGEDSLLLKSLRNAKESDQRRIDAARALASISNKDVLLVVDGIIANSKQSSADFRGKLLTELARLKDDKVADVVLKHYAKLEPELQPKAIELLTQRANWSRKLLAAIGKKQVPANAINLNQARRLMGFKDKGLQDLVRKHWGVVRTERDPQRARYVAKWKAFLRKTPGDPFKGAAVFKKVCGQCHKIYGEGAEVGPDITRNGRNSYDQLLSNVFDPSLVIGASYRAYTVATKEGRVITGLVVENSKQRIVLKIQGGKQETIPRGDIEFEKESKVSMMPEQLEKQLKPQEIADLFAFLVLDKHPKDPNAKQLPGTRRDPPKRRRRKR